MTGRVPIVDVIAKEIGEKLEGEKLDTVLNALSLAVQYIIMEAPKEQREKLWAYFVKHTDEDLTLRQLDDEQGLH